MNWEAQCKCGWRESAADQKQAEVLADVHETRARVAHKHDAVAVEVQA